MTITAGVDSRIVMKWDLGPMTVDEMGPKWPGECQRCKSIRFIMTVGGCHDDAHENLEIRPSSAKFHTFSTSWPTKQHVTMHHKT